MIYFIWFLIAVLAIVFIREWIWLAQYTREPKPKPEVHVPATKKVQTEAEFVQRVKQIKTLADAGRHDKALALLSKLEVLDSNINVIPVNSGVLKE